MRAIASLMRSSVQSVRSISSLRLRKPRILRVVASARRAFATVAVPRDPRTPVEYVAGSRKPFYIRRDLGRAEAAPSPARRRVLELRESPPCGNAGVLAEARARGPLHRVRIVTRSRDTPGVHGRRQCSPRARATATGA